MSTNNKNLNRNFEISEEFFRKEGSYFLAKRGKKDRKFNMRIKNSDLYLIDRLAIFYEVSRSTIINFLLFQAFRKELFNVNESDLQVLLAHYADGLVDYDELEIPWEWDIAKQRDCLSSFNYLLKYGTEGYLPQLDEYPEGEIHFYHSEEFLAVQKLLTEGKGVFNKE